ncbi:MAG: TetR/AcrR family transcriptional regulator [Ruminococcus sp.]|nr:TetR/AcrR family transcriptional regulator [Ruminococcus sp.]
MKENKIEIILNSAEELMCAMEFPNRDITVDMIAKNAGIGKGSIYYYFESKEDIIDAVIERSYSSAIREYFTSTNNCINTYEKLKKLFTSMIRKEFQNNSRNVIISLHVQDDIILHYKMMMTAIKTVSPIVTQILKDGVADGSVHTETPEESAEMIVAMLTFLLNSSFFPSDNESMYRKLKLYANVLETCLNTEKGSFSFLFTKPE